MKFSANLGYLWSDLYLPEAIRAAALAGFDAVECQYPYAVPVAEVTAALSECGLRMLGLNTRYGDHAAGDFGLSALPGREAQARAAIDQAIAYAAAIGAQNVHVLAGIAAGEAARQTFVANLRYACGQAADRGLTVLIEPLNHHDVPGYFLQSTTRAQALIDEIEADNLKLMFDCYHVQILEGEVPRRLRTLLPIIGHIQIASVPERREPDSGELDYREVMRVLAELEYTRPVGAEYRPSAGTADGLGWMALLRQAAAEAAR